MVVSKFYDLEHTILNQLAIIVYHLGCFSILIFLRYLKITLSGSDMLF
jgi:hypothetical protein